MNHSKDAYVAGFREMFLSDGDCGVVLLLRNQSVDQVSARG